MTRVGLQIGNAAQTKVAERIGRMGSGTDRPGMYR